MKNRATATDQTFRASAYFEPDILTTDQYYKVFRQRANFLPEQKLMFAVLTDAIECFQKYLGATSRRSHRLFSEASAWINSREGGSPFSFEQVCEVLSINPSYLRLGLLQWRMNHESQKGPRKRIREPLRYQYRVKNNRVCI